MNIAENKTRLDLQGDKVLIVGQGESERNALLLTIIHVIDVSGRHLLLVNREDKKREEWELTQEMVDAFERLKNHKEAKWRLAV